MTLVCLPAELLGMVLGCLRKSDLKVARQTCKLLGNAVVPLLFDTVYIAANHIDMEKAGLLCSHFGPFVYNLRYGSLIYERRSLYGFVNANLECFKELDSGSDDELNITGEIRYQRLSHTQRRDLQMFWTLYCNLTEEQETFITSGDFLSQLCQLLRASPKISKITIDDLRSIDNCSCYEALVDAGKRYCFPLPDARELFAAFKRHDDEHWCYGTASSLISASNNPMIHLLDALATTQLSVTEISVDPLDYSESETNALHMSGIRLTSENFQILCETLLGLTELTLRFKTPYEWPFSIASSPYRPTILCVAVNLRILHLEITDVDDQTNLSNYVIKPKVFDALMATCSFPKLECLFLSNIDGTEAEVLHFMQRSPKLKSLTLQWLYLTSGTWAHLLEGLRRSLKLEKVEIEEAEGKRGEVYSEDLDPCSEGDYKNWASVVTAFFLNSGPNPFLQETWQENQGDDKDEYDFSPVTSQ